MRVGGTAICQNCSILLTASESTFLSMSNIHDNIRRRNLPFTVSLYKLLGMTLKDGMQNFADILLEAKNEFEEYNSLVISTVIEDLIDNRYIFKDTFFDWVEDRLPPSDVEFKPSSIIHMTSSLTLLPGVIAANQWSYDKVTGEFYTLRSNFRLKYYTDYPYKCKLLESDEWSNDSGVYLVSDPNFFYDQVAYNILVRIKEYSNIINLAGFSSQLQLDNTIARLKDRIDENRSNKSSNMYDKWRNI